MCKFVKLFEKNWLKGTLKKTMWYYDVITYLATKNLGQLSILTALLRLC